MDRSDFLKSIVHGLPLHYGLDTQEAMFRTSAQTLDLLRKKLPNFNSYRESSQSAPQMPSFVQASIAGIDNLQDFEARRREERRDNEMRKIAESTRRQNDTVIDLLESVDRNERAGMIQRVAMIDGMKDVAGEIEKTRKDLRETLHDVSGAMYGVHGAVDSLHSTTKEGLDEIKKHTVLLQTGVQLDGLTLQEMQQHTELLNMIAQLEGLALNEFCIQTRIQKEMLQELVTGNEHAAAIRVMVDDIVRILRNMHLKLASIDYRLAHPKTQISQEQWGFGERWRRLGNHDKANEHFENSKNENSTNPAPYYSLGLMSLELSALTSAYDFFMTSYNLAQSLGDKSFSIQCRLRLGAISSDLGNTALATTHFNGAYDIDKTQSEALFHLARISARSGDKNECIYYIDGIVKRYHFARNPSLARLIQKMRNTPEFAPYLTTLSL